MQLEQTPQKIHYHCKSFLHRNETHKHRCHGIVSAPLTLLSMASALLIISRIVSWAASDKSVDASFNSFSAIGFASTSATTTIDSPTPHLSAQSRIPKTQAKTSQNPHNKTTPTLSHHIANPTQNRNHFRKTLEWQQNIPNNPNTY